MNKILVINNDFDTMTLLKSWLESKSYKVEFTGNQHEALSLINTFKPDVLMVDILQYKIIEQLRKTDTNKNIPVLMMSGYAKGHENLQIYVDDIIEKPFNLMLLQSKLEKIFVKDIGL